MTTITITKNQNSFFLKHIVEVRGMTFNLHSPAVEGFIAGLQGQLSEENQAHFENTPIEAMLSVYVRIANGRGNYGTYKPDGIPSFSHQDNTFNVALLKATRNNIDGWNMFGYLLSLSIVSKVVDDKSQFDQYWLTMR